ncbi:MAG: NAD(P)-binding protein [Vicinamibacterales bacterium]
MSVVAIIGAGPLGASIAHTLARRARVRDVRLIDATSNVAAGKALDIKQAGPIEAHDTSVSGHSDILAAAGAGVIVIADGHESGEWEGDRGLAMIRQLTAAGAAGPFVFAGSTQTWLMEATAQELGVPADRIVGTAAAALTGAVRALVSLEANGSGADVSLVVTGRPPAFVVAWSSSTIGGALITDRVAPHRLAAISQQLHGLWPNGPYAIAAATAPVVEGLLSGTRAHIPAVVIVDRELGVRTRAALLPVTLGNGRVLARHMPSLSQQEHVEFMNALTRG